MVREPRPIQLVIFDCDGVLIDSEGPANQVVAEEITALGWPMTTAESMALFMGFRLSDMPPVVEQRLGRPAAWPGTWPDDWIEHLRARMIERFATVQTVPGAEAALRAVLAMGLPLRVASNSSHEEMAVKFDTTGLAPLVAGRRHSARDVSRGKPAPDVFLAAAAAEGVRPAACLVVEDSLPGVQAAVAAGMAVVGLDMHGDGAALRAAGAVVIHDLVALPALIAARQHAAA